MNTFIAHLQKKGFEVVERSKNVYEMYYEEELIFVIYLEGEIVKVFVINLMSSRLIYRLAKKFSKNIVEEKMTLQPTGGLYYYCVTYKL
jgi:hypothetical protein